MSIISSLSSICLWLALAAAATAQNNYPATIEVDLLFPRNETYNNDFVNIPIVFAIQNARVAYDTEWRINWNITDASSDSDSSSISGSHFSTESFSPVLPTRINDFRYYFKDDVAVVPTSPRYAHFLSEGAFRLDWEYAVDPCFPEDKNVVYGPMPRVARGSHYFSIADDDSAADFDIPLDECPIYGDMWTKASSSSDCPLTSDSQDVEKDPCAAQLQTAEQMECLRDYFFDGKNDTEACLSGFQTVTEGWIEGEGSVEEESDSDTKGDGGSEDNEDAAVLLRPGVFELVITVLAAVALY